MTCRRVISRCDSRNPDTAQQEILLTVLLPSNLIMPLSTARLHFAAKTGTERITPPAHLERVHARVLAVDGGERRPSSPPSPGAESSWRACTGSVFTLMAAGSFQEGRSGGGGAGSWDKDLSTATINERKNKRGREGALGPPWQSHPPARRPFTWRPLAPPINARPLLPRLNNQHCLRSPLNSQTFPSSPGAHEHFHSFPLGIGLS